MSPGTRGNLHFALAAVVLAGSAVFLQAANSYGLLRVLKRALPIRRPLIDLDRGPLAPFKIVGSSRLSPESEEELGTKEYLNCIIRAPASSGLGDADINLTISYYTGVQDQVPHVPEECFWAGGLIQDNDDTLAMELTRLGEVARDQGGRMDRLDIRRLSFSPPKGRIGTRIWVYYTIAVNGEFHPNRQLVRLKMADPFDTHLYYSKVEIGIPAPAQADLAALDSTANELLDRVMGALLKSHWPRLGWERGGPPAAAEATGS